MAGSDYERCALCEEKAFYAGEMDIGDCAVFHAGCLNAFKAQVLREAAMQIDWIWETFDASDGIKSIRQHGKTPGQLLAQRAGDIEEGRL